MKRLLFSLLLLSNISFAQVNLNLGLRAYYPFSGNANDVSGNNNNPIFNNATLTTDRLGNPNSAYHFNGTNNYMQIPNSATLNMGAAMSVALWVKPTGYYTGQCYNNMLVMKGTTDFQTGSYSLRFADEITGCTTPNTALEHFYGAGPVAPTPAVQLNQWYSVVYTNDGTTASIYVDCILRASAPSAVSNFTTVYDLFFGHMTNVTFPYWLNGDMDEIRIYDRALTINEVNVLGGCPVNPTPISGTINTYTPVLALNPCDNKITVEDASTFNTGDTVLMIQMKGAVIDSSNTAAFGTITDYKNAGNYEFNYVKSKAGNIIELKNILTRQYDIPTGKVQLVRVPYYNSVSVTSTLTCLPWDGSKGGILVLNARDTVNLAADIDVSGNGFLGGDDPVSVPAVFNCNENQYYYPVNPDLASQKGEGIAIISAARSFGKGALANGGGSGNSHNSGGAGGGNIGIGGMGGYQFEGSPCDGTVPFDNRGVSGKSLTYSTALNKIFLGGGGGAGHSNNPEGFQAKGGNGAGIIMILADKIKNNARKIIADGNAGISCGLTNNGCHEGMGGGGAAGTVLLKVNGYIDNATVETKGGNGANMVSTGNLRVGPGGGGSGGALWLNNASLPANVTVTNTGGSNGVCTGYANDPWGAAAGAAGSNLFNLVVPVDIVPFQKNIDSVRIKDSLTSCLHYDLKGFGYTNTNPISTWQWYFGDGGTAGTQNTSHIYGSPGTYTVKLVVTDINGCKDSISSPLTVAPCTVPISNIINTYTPVLALNPCDNRITVEDASTFNTGDTVLMIQMKGAIIDSSNTAAFGTITDYKNSGNYEFNYVKSKASNVIELKNKLTRQYDIPFGKVQLVRVPYYNSVTVTGTLSCLPWDGSKGGILVLNVRDTVSMAGDIDVSGKGFKGAPGFNAQNQTLTCFQNNYNYPINTINAVQKGESITTISNNIICGKGNPAAGGGGGVGHNSGGGGGGNGGNGGFGGYQLEPCGSAPFDNRGIGGKQLIYSTPINRIFMGSGGGAGHEDNIGTLPADGGNGAGIVLIIADKIQSNSKKIIAKGDDGLPCVITGTSNCHDGMGGGGAGGTVLLNINQFIDNSIVLDNGGKGADVLGDVPAGGRIGPGGGGGGGLSFLKAASVPANLSIVNTGGANGVLITDSNNPWGATPGATGTTLFNLVVPVDNIAFQKNIDSVRIKDSLTSCLAIDFKGLGYTNTNPISTWQWYFGDGGTANTQNTSHTYGSLGIFTVKLVVTDINGCKDSVQKNVNTNANIADAGNDTTICSNGPVSVTLHGNAGATSYLWSPAIYLNNPTIQNPIATISTTTRFYLTVTTSLGCNGTDSVTITLNPVPTVRTLTDTAICKRTLLILTTTPGATTYHWSPGIYVSDSTISNPAFIDTVSRTLYVTGTNAFGCSASDTINVTVKPLPIVKTINDTVICSTNPLTLFTSGAQTYSWTPINNLSNPNIANPVYFGNLSQTYYVTGTAANGCIGKDTVSITVHLPNNLNAPPDKFMCATASVQLDGNNGNTVQYLWSPGTYLSATTVPNPIAFPPFSTAFNVIITDVACNYNNSFTVFVTVDPLPVINAGKSNDIDCSAHSAILHASGGTQYLWSPSIHLSSTIIPNPVATPTSTQQYIVIVKDALGCANKDSVTVFSNVAASLARFMPNAFTPNGDGLNDCYGLKNWLLIQQLEFMIFDRWGEKVFSTTNPSVCWDGTYKGKPSLAGTYVYYIKAQTACGLEEQKGTFLLIR